MYTSTYSTDSDVGKNKKQTILLFPLFPWPWQTIKPLHHHHFNTITHHTQLRIIKQSSFQPNYPSSHAIILLQIMPTPVPALEFDPTLAPLLPPFEPYTNSLETHYEGLYQERPATFIVLRPSPDRRETTTISILWEVCKTWTVIYLQVWRWVW